MIPLAPWGWPDYPPLHVPSLSPRDINGRSQNIRLLLQCIRCSLLLKSRAQTASEEGLLLLEKNYTAAVTTLWIPHWGMLAVADHAFHSRSQWCILKTRSLPAQPCFNPWKFILKNNHTWASLVAQWLRVCLPMRGTRVRALVWEDPTCRGASGPVSHNY